MQRCDCNRRTGRERSGAGWRRWLALFGLPCALACGCNRSQPPVRPTEPPKVTVSTPTLAKITDYEDFSGRTEALKTIDVRSRVSGYLEKVLFEAGAEVKEGDPLFIIDQRTYQAELNRAEANVRQSKAHLSRLQIEYDRDIELLRKKVISQEDFDRAAGDRDEAAAAVELAEATRDLAQLNLTFTTVRWERPTDRKEEKPIKGRISRQMVDPGNLVKADDTILTTVVSLDPIYAYFDVDERTDLKVKRLIQAGKVKSARKTAVKVYLGLVDEDNEELSDKERFPHEGTIDFIDNREEATTGTLRLRGIFPNADQLLVPGRFARIRVPIGEPHEAILIPERALGSDQGRKYVWVLDEENKPLRRYLEVGALVKPEASQGGLRVVRKGLALKERIVVDGLQRVRPGVEVTPQDIKPAAAAAPKPSDK